MTEAVDLLKKYTDGKQNTEKVEISVLQLNRVIKALEQEPCEDAISRADAILQIQRHGVGCFDPDEFSPEVCERFVIDLISKLPSYRIEYENKELCDDAISRQDVLFELTNGAYDGETTEQFIDRVAKEIESAPPVNPQPKTEVLDKIRAWINSPNRGTCDYFIVDRIEEIIDKYRAEFEG